MSDENAIIEDEISDTQSELDWEVPNIYLFDKDGFYTETSTAEKGDVFGSYTYPNNATTIPIPELTEGTKARWDGIDWVIVSIEELNTIRKNEIYAILDALDIKQVRPLASIEAARFNNTTPDPKDEEKVAEIQQEKIALRTELATL
jgi:hypothetical protein